MPDIKLYDYQRGLAPKGTKITCYFTPPKKYSSIAHTIAPWTDAPLICGFYDEDNDLIGVRFIRKDGTWEDVA